VKLVIEQNDRYFEHGEIKIVRKDGIEKLVNISIDLVITEDIESLKEELEELIAKYAI